MFNFTSLYSGSSGNCLLVQSNNTNILVDAGVSQRKISAALASFSLTFEDIDAIVVTHEHVDHISSVGSISKKYDIPVYINLETLSSIPNQKDKISDNNKRIFSLSKSFQINDIIVNGFSIPHDAANPCGFNFYYRDKKITIATDIGHIDNRLITELKDSSFVLLEANYDPDILKYSRYPYQLKQRILGENGHLSNETSGKTLAELTAKHGLKHAMLGHLSKENNFPELALKTVLDELKKKNIAAKDLSLSVASRDFPSKTIKL